MKIHLYSVAFAFLLFTQCTSVSYLNDDQLLTHSDAVTAEGIKSHIAVLANDSMKGRLPGTPEYKIAMNYVADEFKNLGLKPMGDGGTYFQNLTIRKGLVDQENSFLVLNDSDTLKGGEDYVFYSDLNKTDSEFEGEVVFAGFGIEAPELGVNDFKSIDMKGKVALVFSGAPAEFPSSERAYFSNLTSKFEALVKHGATGVVLVVAPGGRGSFPGIAKRLSTRGNTGVFLPSGEVIGRSVSGSGIDFVSSIDKPILERLVGISIDTLWGAYSEGKGTLLQPVSKTKLSGKVTNQYEDFSSANVVGVLEGGELRDEYIVHSAHLDHVGIGEPVAGDSIYNGAHDNASGTSSMIEIARLYHNLPSKPRRSVLFVAVTAEEMGLLGSAYFAENLPLDRQKVIANINTDMPTLIAPLLSIEPLGAQHSSIINEVNRAAGLLNLSIMDDHMPEQVRFVRSDQYNFILQGIPSLHIKYGLKGKDSDTELKEKIEAYTNNVYHKPSDELNDLFDFEAGRTYVKLQFMISYFINTAAKKPVWNEGDFFERFVVKK